MIKLNSNTPIILYGAGEIGDIIGKNIIDVGYRLIGYIDRKQYGKEKNGVPIFSTEEYIYDYSNCLVIVCLSDGTQHKDVVSFLYDKGYRYFIFIPFGYRFEDSISAQLNSLFDAFQYGEIETLENIHIEKFDEISKRTSGYDRFINSDDNDWINMYVDTELLFTETGELWEGDKTKINGKHLYWDKNICFYHPYIMLMKTLLGQGESVDEYWESYDKLPFDKFDRLKNRELLVKEYEYHKSRNDRFFVECAPKAVLNPMGYWNLHGGHHRTAYLLAKGERFIPIKVKKCHYEKWSNISGYKKCKERIDELSGGKLKTIINHPAFINYEGERENTTNRLFIDVFSDVDVYEKRVKSFLDYSDMDGFFARNVVRQKLGTVDIAENDRVELIKLIDEVLGVKDINYCKYINEDTSYDVVFFINRFKEIRNDSEKYINVVSKCTREKLFIEIYREDFERINEKLLIRGFKNSRSIHKEVLNGIMVETYVYEK